MHSYAYPIDILEDENGYSALFIGLPGGTCAPTREKLMVQARDCLEEILAGFINRKEDIPKPMTARGKRRIRPGILMAAKTSLYEIMRQQKISNVALATRLKCHESDVRRMIDPRHATKIASLERALDHLGIQLAVEALKKAA